MAEYIEKSAAVALADYAADEHPYEKQADKPETCSEYNQGWNDACDYIRDKLEKEPAADVAPVRRGRWISYGNGRYYCSECNHTIAFNPAFIAKHRYCRVCNAFMDLEGEA